MLRALLPIALVLLLVTPAAVLAEEKPQEKPIPPLADDEQAAEALKVFKKAYKAVGYKGDEKTAMREVAMNKFARTQHVVVADRLFKLTKDRNADIRTLAVMYLGKQRALPGYAGPLVIKAIEKNKSDAIFAMFAIEAIETLKYRGEVKLIRALMAHKDDGVKKMAILFIGDAKEWRLLDDLLKLMKEFKIDKGWKTEGHEVRYDTGAAGDHDQKMAEKIYRQKYGKSGKKARGGARAMRDMKPVLLETMKNLTGEDFFTGKSSRDWAEDNKEKIEKEQKILNDVQKKQALDAEKLQEK